MQKDDFLICKESKNPRKFLVRVSSLSKDVVHGVLEKDYYIPSRRKSIEVPVQNIVCNLGQNPLPGKVYGVDTTHWLAFKNHDAFGKIHFFTNPGKELGRALMKAFDVAEHRLHHYGLDNSIEPSLIYEVRPRHGKLAGRYFHSRDEERYPHRIELYPEIMATAVSKLPYVILHEHGHHIHAKYLTQPKVNAAWIKLFNTSIAPRDIPVSLSKRILKELLSSGEAPSRAVKLLDEDDAAVCRFIYRYISKERSIGISELDFLAASGNNEAIEELWPTHSLEKKELAPIITDYAAKNFRETFAEAFSLHLTGIKLPKAVVSLLEKSIQHAANLMG